MGGLHLTQRRIPQGPPGAPSAGAGEVAPSSSGGPRKRAPSSGMLMLRSHEQPITAEMYLRYGGDKWGGPGAPPSASASGARGGGAGGPPGGPSGGPSSSFLQASAGSGAMEPPGASAASTAAAAAATVKYRMFVLNQCKEEIFFQDVDPASDFVVEGGPNHVFYKTPDDTQQGQPAVYALWMYDDNERIRLEAALRELLQPEETAGAAAAAAPAPVAASAEAARSAASGSSSSGALPSIKLAAAAGMQQQQQQQQQQVQNGQTLNRTESEGEKAGRALLSLLTGGVPVPAPFCGPTAAAEDPEPCVASCSAPAAAAPAAAPAAPAAEVCGFRAERKPLNTSEAIISLLKQQRHQQHEQQQMIRRHGNRSERQQREDAAIAARSAPALRAPEEASPNPFGHAAEAAAAEAPPLSLPRSPSSIQGSANWNLMQMLKGSLPGPITAVDPAATAATAKDGEEELLLVSRSGLKKAFAAALRSDDFHQLLWRELQLQQHREQQQQQQQQRRR
ncbi:hypothetical protein Emed_002868 [Eimeria media]